jgi:hypothetical protein
LPALDREQFITGHSSGFALREAMQRLPELVPSDVPIIGSLFPDSCRRANFYAVGRQLLCADRGGEALLTAHLQAQIGACLLAELPPIGIPMAAYARTRIPTGALRTTAKRRANSSVVRCRTKPLEIIRTRDS